MVFSSSAQCAISTIVSQVISPQLVCHYEDASSHQLKTALELGNHFNDAGALINVEQEILL